MTHIFEQLGKIRKEEKEISNPTDSEDLNITKEQAKKWHKKYCIESEEQVLKWHEQYGKENPPPTKDTGTIKQYWPDSASNHLPSSTNEKKFDQMTKKKLQTAMGLKISP